MFLKSAHFCFHFFLFSIFTIEEIFLKRLANKPFCVIELKKKYAFLILKQSSRFNLAVALFYYHFQKV